MSSDRLRQPQDLVTALLDALIRAATAESIRDRRVLDVGCGTGINVIRPAGDAALAAIEPPPAFLSDRAPGVQRGPVLAAILRAFEDLLPQLDDPAGVANAWERRAGLAGTPYRLLLDGEATPLDAVAKRLDRDGSLVVEEGGRERRITLADARVLRT